LWGLCTNRSRDIARQALLWMPPATDAALAAATCRWAAAFPLVLMCSLRDDHTLQEVLQVKPAPASMQPLYCVQSNNPSCSA
jgi:predicted membrane chloride channel (bestrophin family)